MITEEIVKNTAGNTIGTVTFKKNAGGKTVSRVLTAAPSLTAIPSSAFADRGITELTIPPD